MECHASLSHENGQHSPETLEELRRRHNMHTLSGN
jgi:hypothetical protein